MICWTLASIHLLSAATYYVNSSAGSDSYSTTQAQNASTPWLTLGHSLPLLAGGDTLICTGTFANNQVTVSANGTAANPITVKGGTITPKGGLSDSSGNFVLNGSYWIFDGQVFDGGGATLATTAVMFQISGNYNTLRNGFFQNMQATVTSSGDTAWMVSDNGTGTVITNWTWLNLNDADLMRLYGNNALVTHCLFTNCLNSHYSSSGNHADLIQTWYNGAGNQLSNTLDSCLMMNIETSGGMLGDWDSTGSTTYPNQVNNWCYRNCVFFNNTQQAIQLAIPYFHFYNCIFYNWTSPTIYWFNGDYGPTGQNNGTHVYNCVFMNGCWWNMNYSTSGVSGIGIDYNYFDSGFQNNQYNNLKQWYGSHNLTNTSPLNFVNAAAGDFHLTAGSVLIGKGINLSTDPSASTVDRDGNPRPAAGAGAWDIGPYQYGTVGSSTNPVIQVSPVAINFGSLAVGASATNTITVQNTGSGTLAGTASVAAPFAIVSGASYSLGAGQSQNVGVSYSPTANGSNSASVTFTGGGGAVVAVSGSAHSLTGIALSPANPSVLTGISQQFTASGTYSDGSKQDLTGSVTWSSSQASVATISAGGLATGVSAGTTTISATLAGVSGSTVLTVQTAPLAISTTTLASGAINVPYTATLAASGGTGPYSWSIASGSLPAGLTLNASSGTIAGTPTAGGTFSITVQVSDAASPADTVTKALSLVVSSQVTIWPSSAAPTTADEGDTSGSAVELGVKFRSDVAGTVMGIRFYKSSANTGTHVGNLWSTNGTLLASATFTSETASGWQQVLFGTPATVTSNTVYVASYHTTNGHYSEDDNYFASSGVDNAPLHALANGASGSNEVYVYSSSSSYPNQSWNSANYWVDIVFQPAVAPAGQPPLPPTNLHVATSN
jgi:hypothetical protein